VSGVPARGYSWPPRDGTFEEGNQAAVKHGARSPALIEPRARELMPAIFEVNPQLDESRDGPAVMRYAICLARIERVLAWLSEQDDPVFEDVGSGKAHGVYERLERWERQASESEDKLAIAPLTRAKLGFDRLRAEATAEELEKTREARARLDARADEVREVDEP
jgi:hypothetical protein